MEYYSAIKINEIELFVVRWMDLETVIQSEVSQKAKNKYRILTHTCGTYKNGTSVSQLLPCKLAHLYHFSRFHIHALIYNICFSLSDLLHSV